MNLPTMRLRDWTKEDVQFLIDNMNDPDIAFRLPVPRPYRVDHALAYIWKSLDWEVNSKVIDFPTVINGQVKATTWRPVGQVSVRPYDGNYHVGLLGYWIAKNERGKGYAANAVRLMVKDAFEVRGYERVQAYMDISNIASQRVVEKAGFVREGVLRSWYLLKGQRRDFYMYSILPRDVF